MKTNLANTIRKLNSRTYLSRSWTSSSNKRRSPANGSNTSSVGGVTSLILLTSMFAIINITLFTSNTSATNSTLTMSIDNTTLSLDILPHSANGDFAKSDNSTISVTTNNYSGYTLSIAASSSTNLAGNNGSIASIGSAVSEADFSADTTTAATNYNGKWGYLPSKLNSSTNTSFQPSPGTGSSGHTLDVTSSANATTPNTYTLAIGARVGSDTAPGGYSNTFVVSAVANLINYTITYNKGNTTDTVSGLPSNTTGTISDPLTGSTNITLSSTEPTRDGYNFLGWCTTNPVAGTGGSADTCSGTTIAASGTYNLNATNNPAVTLYALWQYNDPCLGKTALYDLVACKSKGTQTLAQLRAAITVPTSADRTQDTSNSGVYEYNTSVFGAATDAASTHKIYYYRGVLENSVGSYGSDGSAATYPNYVILDADGSKTTADTCWRIVRTTGSGGVKMIYNGKWTGTTCANATTNAQVTTQAFNATSNIGNKSIIAVGYTFNPSYKTTTGSTAYSTLFGSNTSYSGNSTKSTIKNYIENTWFTNINSYSSILEPSAGYCNDRTIYTTTSGTGAQTAVADSYSISTPYTTASSGITQYFFGARIRTGTTVQAPTLGCPRSNADLYTTSSASNGNKQLAKPAALITADEAAFAGSGYSSSTTPYHANSYLRSGSYFWLLSPNTRLSSGNANGFALSSNGLLNVNLGMNGSYGVRPAISLTSGTTIASGSGTATDPWVIEEPKTMQSVTISDLATLTPNTGDTTTLPDARDGQEYTIAKLADGKYWMTTNLNLAGGTTLNASDSNVPSDNYYTLPASTTISSGTAVQSGQFLSDTTAYVFNTGNNTTTCNSSTPCNSYYSWLAATAGGKNSSGSSVTTNGYNAAYSICPKGWRLPTSTTSNANAQTSPNWKTGDWYALATAYGANLESSYYQNAASFYNNAGPGTTPGFLLAGYYNNGSFLNGGSRGFYWSSTARSSTSAYPLYFNSGYVDSANIDSRRYGFSVRCVYGD